MKTCLFAAVAMIGLSSSAAFAVVLEDFESGYGGPGSLITDPADAGNTVLHLVSNRGVSGTLTDIFTIDTDGFVGKITMDIYDFGATTWDGPLNPPFPADGGTDHGPRWGIQGDSNSDGTLDNWVAAGIMQKSSWLDANKGYAYLHDDIADDSLRAFSFSGDWFSPAFFSNPRRVEQTPIAAAPGPTPGDGLQLIGSGTPESPQAAGSGAWTTWEFDIDASGNVVITAKAGVEGTKYETSPYEDDSKTTYNSANMTIVNMKQIWVTGGQGDNDTNGFLGSLIGTHGVLVDNVTFDGATSFSPADFDTDGDVDADDLTIWQAAYGSAPGGDTNSDADSDGADFLTWQQEHTGAGAVAATGSVPEPSTALLLLSGVLAMTGLTSRKRG